MIRNKLNRTWPLFRTRVYVVVDPEFGEKLAQLERGAPVWIVDSPTNKPVVQRFWNEHPNESHLTGITTFHNWDSLSPEDMLLRKLGRIKLRHGLGKPQARVGQPILRVRM
jgi:hypothetical protein